MSRRTIEGCYARLKGIRDTLAPNLDAYVNDHFSQDFEAVLSSLREDVDDEFEAFDLPRGAFRRTEHSGTQVQREAVVSKVMQILAYLEAVHNASNRVIEIGSAFNLIRDDNLKSRCADLLSASGHFDRVINQATLVLEERIRQKVPDFTNDIGLVLVGKAINGETGRTRIRFSMNASEQEGYANIFRGLIGAFRNPSHHRFLDNVTREQALQICAFIDNMLAALETAEVVREN